MKHNWERLYANYSRKYDELDAKLPAHMYGEKLDQMSFENAYRGVERNRLEQQQEGKRRKSLNVMRDILNTQKYQYSKEQASAITKAIRRELYKGIDENLSKKEYKDAIKQINKDITFNKFRNLQIKDQASIFFDKIKAEYKRLKDMTIEIDGTKVSMYSAEERKQMISQTFFGS